MFIILGLYFAGVYLVFFKFKVLPLNKFTETMIALVGLTIGLYFYVALQTLTPASVRGEVTGPITEISSQVQGVVIEVPVAFNQEVEANEVLFRINPRSYQDRVDQLQAQLVQTEATVAQLKQSLDAAQAQVGAVEANLKLSRSRLADFNTLLSSGAGNKFNVQNMATQVASQEQQLLGAQAQEKQAAIALNARVGDTQSQIAQVLAQLDQAQFDLENCEVRAPADGWVAMNMLRPGMVISPGRAVMTFIYTDALGIGGIFPQKGLQNIREGDKAVMTFPALPGRVFQSTVRRIPRAIGNAQIAASGQLIGIGESRMTNLYPVYVELPDDFPEDQIRLGLAASIKLHSENAGAVGAVATMAQWIQTSLAYVL
jgi:multidrug resistance efflux pump